jgi:Cytochrome P460
MSELLTKPVAHAQQEQKIETRAAAERIAGVPGSGRTFPEGSMIVKLQWKPKKSTEAPFVVDVPDVFKQAFVMEKNSKKISEKRRVGIRGVQLRRCIGPVHGRSQKPFRLRKHVPYGREGEELHLPPVRAALNRDLPRH